MSAEQLCTASSENLKKSSWIDVISSTIDVAVSRVASNHKRGLDSHLSRPTIRPPQISRVSGRPASLTYDDIISRSLMANCRGSLKPDTRPSTSNERKRKAKDAGEVLGQASKKSVSRSPPRGEGTEDSEIPGLFKVYDLISRTLVNYQEEMVETNPESCNVKSTEKVVPKAPRVMKTMTLPKKLITTSMTKTTKAPAKPVYDLSVALQRNQFPIALRATEELTSIPDSTDLDPNGHPQIEDLIRCCSGSSSTRYRRISPGGTRSASIAYRGPAALVQAASRKPRGGVIHNQGVNHGATSSSQRLRGAARGAVPNKREGTEAKDTQLLYLSSQPQTSKESVIFGDNPEDIIDLAEFKTESEEMFSVLVEWRERQLKDFRSEFHLVDQVAKHFRGQPFSKTDLRDFLRKSRAEQVARLHTAVSDLNDVEEFIDKMERKEKLSDEQLAIELQCFKENVLSQCITDY